MALPTLTWRALVEQTPADNTVASYIAAVKAAFDAITYKDGSGRTAGSGLAWSTSGGSASAFQLSPPSGSPAGCRVVIAGDPGAKTPPMASPDLWLASCLLALVSSNGGTLGTWDAATPLGAGIRLTGYTKFSPATTGAVLGTVRCFESAEAVGIFLKNGTSTYGILIGALWDPMSTDSLDAEADGRLYGYITSGTIAISSTFLSDTGGGAFSGAHGGGNGGSHNQCLVPGTGNLRSLNRCMNIWSSVAAFAKGKSGNWWTLPCWHQDITGGSENIVGELRQVRPGPRGRIGQKWSSGGTVRAYLVGGSDSADVDCLHLMY